MARLGSQHNNIDDFNWCDHSSSWNVTMLKTNPITNTTMNLSNHIIIIISSLFLQIWEQGWQWYALVEVRHEIQWSKEEKALGR